MAPDTDRKNGNIFLATQLLIYLCAPVRYIGGTQAALCDKLGASAALANLPTSAYFFGGFAPLIACCFIPRRWERGTVILTSWLFCLVQTIVAAALVLPLGSRLKIYIVVGQSLLLGLMNTIQQVYLLQCLGRGTTEAGRARALKLAFAVGPIAAFAGSLLAQWILRGNVPGAVFPRDFALLYLIGVPCSAVMAVAYTRYELGPLPEETRPRFFTYMGENFANFLRSPPLILLWIAYFLWYFTFQSQSNFTLFARHAMGREPTAFVGVMGAIQFGSKAVAGYGFGVLYGRYGVRAPLIATVVAVGLAVLWAWTVSGYWYLATFALLGAGQLGGIYFPNVLLSWKTNDAARYLAVLSLAGTTAAIAPAAYGHLTDRYGFSAAFLLAGAAAAAGLVLVLTLPARRLPDTPLPL